MLLYSTCTILQFAFYSPHCIFLHNYHLGTDFSSMNLPPLCHFSVFLHVTREGAHSYEQDKHILPVFYNCRLVDAVRHRNFGFDTNLTVHTRETCPSSSIAFYTRGVGERCVPFKSMHSVYVVVPKM